MRRFQKLLEWEGENQIAHKGLSIRRALCAALGTLPEIFFLLLEASFLLKACLLSFTPEFSPHHLSCFTIEDIPRKFYHIIFKTISSLLNSFPHLTLWQVGVDRAWICLPDSPLFKHHQNGAVVKCGLPQHTSVDLSYQDLCWHSRQVFFLLGAISALFGGRRRWVYQPGSNFYNHKTSIPAINSIWEFCRFPHNRPIHTWCYPAVKRRQQGSA